MPSFQIEDWSIDYFLNKETRTIYFKVNSVGPDGLQKERRFAGKYECIYGDYAYEFITECVNKILMHNQENYYIDIIPYSDGLDLYFKKYEGQRCDESIHCNLSLATEKLCKEFEEQFEKVCEDFEYDVRQVIQELRSMTRNYQREYDMTDALKYILSDIILEELQIKL